MRKLTLILGRSTPTLNDLLVEKARGVHSVPVIIVPPGRSLGAPDGKSPIHGTALHVDGKRKPVAASYPKIVQWLDQSRAERVADRHTNQLRGEERLVGV